MTNFWLRTEFRERPARAAQTAPAATPRQRYVAAIARFRSAIEQTIEAKTELDAIIDETGTSLAEVEGIDEATAKELRAKLGELLHAVTVYRATWNRRR